MIVVLEGLLEASTRLAGVALLEILSSQPTEQGDDLGPVLLPGQGELLHPGLQLLQTPDGLRPIEGG